MEYYQNDTHSRRDMQELNEIEDLIFEEYLGEALRRLRQFLSGMPFADIDTQLGAIETDYQLMCDYMLRGFRDEKREELHHALTSRAYRLVRDVMTRYAATHEPRWEALSRMQQKILFDTEDIRQHLEAFVYDTALASLETEDTRTERLRDLHLHHHTYLQQLFAAILLSPLWSSSFAVQMGQVLLSPSVDVADVQLLITAVMLSCQNSHDPERLAMLIRVYEQAEEVHVRQRALVGWTLCAHFADPLKFEKQHRHIASLLAKPEVRKEIYEMQIQMIYCLNTKRDSDKIQKDIMPTLLRNQRFDLSQSDILPHRNEAALQDMLHPDETERKMEEMEKSLQHVMDMRNQGVDIYFSGFAQMKRFSFFYTLCNWFMPFTADHPQLQHLPADFLHSRMIDTILRGGMFCDSDKYSFVLATSSVMQKLPDQLKEAINSGDAIPDMGMAGEQQLNDAQYVRRMYLQDLYRFFVLSDDSKLFVNPFDEEHYLFLTASPFVADMHAEASRVEKFLIKQKRYKAAGEMLDAYYDYDDLGDQHLQALLHMHDKEYVYAQNTYLTILGEHPDDEEAMKGYAQASFELMEYEKSAHYYGELSSRHVDNRFFALNYAISLIYCNRAEEATQVLFKLDYELPDDINVKRAMAWSHLWQSHLQEATDLYAHIITMPKSNAADLLNAAYCSWFAGNIGQATQQITESMQKGRLPVNSPADVQTQIGRDSILMLKYGVGVLEIKLMSELVYKKSL